MFLHILSLSPFRFLSLSFFLSCFVSFFLPHEISEHGWTHVTRNAQGLRLQPHHIGQKHQVLPPPLHELMMQPVTWKILDQGKEK